MIDFVHSSQRNYEVSSLGPARKHFYGTIKIGACSSCSREADFSKTNHIIYFISIQDLTLRLPGEAFVFQIFWIELVYFSISG